MQHTAGDDVILRKPVFETMRTHAGVMPGPCRLSAPCKDKRRLSTRATANTMRTLDTWTQTAQFQPLS